MLKQAFSRVRVRAHYSSFTLFAFTTFTDTLYNPLYIKK